MLTKDKLSSLYKEGEAILKDKESNKLSRILTIMDANFFTEGANKKLIDSKGALDLSGYENKKDITFVQAMMSAFYEKLMIEALKDDIKKGIVFDAKFDDKMTSDRFKRIAIAATSGLNKTKGPEAVSYSRLLNMYKLSIKLIDFAKNISDEKETANKLRQTNETLQGNIKNSNEELLGLKKTNETLQGNIKKSDEELLGLKKANETLQGNIKKSDEELLGLKKANETLQGNIKNSNEELLGLKKANDTLQGNIKKLNEELLRLKQENEGLNKDLGTTKEASKNNGENLLQAFASYRVQEENLSAVREKLEQETDKNRQQEVIADIIDLENVSGFDDEEPMSEPNVSKFNTPKSKL